MKPTIGFIGLGLLGGAMARRLLTTGHRVIGFDIDTDKIAALENAGLEPALSPEAMVSQCDIIQLCVTTTDAVAAVVSGEQGIESAGKHPGKVLVDHSTTDYSTTKCLAASLLESSSISFVDAPVSGGPDAAFTGTLSIMAGGSVAACQQIARVMAELGTFTHMGDVGAGQATKLVNQALVLPAYCVIADALRLAQSYGVDADKIPLALKDGHAGSNLLPILFERMIAEDFAPAGYARQILKDLEMLHTATKENALPMTMASQALNQFRTLVASGKGELDGSAVITLTPRPQASKQ